MPNLFDADLADLKPYPELADTVKWASDLAKASKDGCYPPAHIKITLFQGPNDPKEKDLITTARQDAMTDYVTGHNPNYRPATPLDKSQFDVSTVPAGSDGKDGEAKFSRDIVDRDPPTLKTNWTPPKGTKVKAGDKIIVKISASERFADGHKSMPTGVQGLRLVADNGPVNPVQMYNPPQPCERKLLEVVYNVPDNPLPVIHLRAQAKDGANPNHVSEEEADFPTADWYGTIKVKGKGNVYDEEGEISFAFSVESNGTVKGRAHFRRTANRPKQFGTTTQTRRYSADEADLQLTGKQEANQFALDMNLEKAGGTVSFNGRNATPANLLAAFTAIAGHPRLRAEDGATNTFHHESPGSAQSSLVQTGSSELHQTNK